MNNTYVQRGHVWLLVLSMTLMGGLAATAEDLTDREVKKLDRQATKAEDTGRLDDVRSIYDQILAGTPAGDARRARALFFVLTQELAASPDALSPSARSALDELLKEFPGHLRRRQIEMFDRWRQQRAAHAAELTEMQTALAKQQQECEAAQGELSGAAGEKEASLNRQVQRLKGQLSTAQQELEATRAELQKKEEALEKLKDALVGGGR